MFSYGYLTDSLNLPALVFVDLQDLPVLVSVDAEVLPLQQSQRPLPPLGQLLPHCSGWTHPLPATPTVTTPCASVQLNDPKNIAI